MKKKSLAIAAAGAAVSALAVAGPALATGTNYKVDLGLPSTSPAQQITAQSVGGVSFSVGNVNMSCASADVPASPVSTVANSPSANTLNLATLKKVNFNNCTGPGGAIIATSVGDWYLHGTGGVSTAATDTVQGHVDNVNATVGNGACNFKVAGFARGTYKEDTKTLVVSETGNTGNLKIQPGAACGPVVVAGAAANFSGTFKVTVANNAVINVKP